MRSNGIGRGCVIQQTQPKDVKSITRERKVRKGAYWHGELKKRSKTNGRKARDSGIHFSVSSGEVNTTSF
jgi:hypothetical protein